MAKSAKNSEYFLTDFNTLSSISELVLLVFNYALSFEYTTPYPSRFYIKCNGVILNKSQFNFFNNSTSLLVTSS
jgi:hypothetical protein